jgi:hypothetical protein
MSTPDPAFAAALAEADRVFADQARDVADVLYEGARRLGMSAEHAALFATRQARRMQAEVAPATREREALRAMNFPAGRC